MKQTYFQQEVHFDLNTKPNIVKIPNKKSLHLP